MPSRFDALLDTEIARLQKPNQGPPVSKSPLSLEEYGAYVEEQKIPKPSADEVKNFIDEVGNEYKHFVQYCLPGQKLVPVIMPHEHGFPGAEPRRLNSVGYLYYYVVTPENRAIRFDGNEAYLDAVFPQEIIANAVTLPDNFAKPEIWQEKVMPAFIKSTEKMLAMVFSS